MVGQMPYKDKKREKEYNEKYYWENREKILKLKKQYNTTTRTEMKY